MQLTVEHSTAVQALVVVGERDACGGGNMSALCMFAAKDRRPSRVWRWRVRQLAAGAVFTSAAACPVAPAAATPACLPACAPACPPDIAGWVAARGAGGQLPAYCRALSRSCPAGAATAASRRRVRCG